jgi:hypothetical protein
MKCPYDGKTVHYKESGLSKKCDRYARYCEKAIRGGVYSGCPAPDVCEKSMLPIDRGIHSIPLSEVVRL